MADSKVLDLRVIFCVFVTSLPACYWTPWPSALSILMFLAAVLNDELQRRGLTGKNYKFLSQSLETGERYAANRFTVLHERIDRLEKELSAKAATPTASGAEIEEQRAALKTLGVLFKELQKATEELRTEVNGLNLRAGFNLRS